MTTEEMVLWEKGCSWIEAIVVDGKLSYTGTKVEDAMQKNPRLQLITMKRAMENIDSVLWLKYDHKKWEEITEDKFMEMLEILPPLKWNTTNGVNMFAMSEFNEAEYTTHYAQYKNRYFRATRKISVPRVDLVNQLKQQVSI